RKGFDLQDHVAARYCIEMIRDDRILEVWCEAHDDVIVIWKTAMGEEVEFIQVKGLELDQLWSLAKLCEQDASSKKKTGTSIIERSLGQHRCVEPCRFRLVTSRPVMDELKVLTIKLESSARAAAKPLMDALAAKLTAKIDGKGIH